MKYVLIGFMGAGKTTVGKLLANAMQRDFIETDHEVVGISGNGSITAIFEKLGEPVFRDLETKVAKKLEQADKVVISTGGGIVTHAINMDYLQNNGTIIFLKIKKKREHYIQTDCLSINNTQILL